MPSPSSNPSIPNASPAQGIPPLLVLPGYGGSGPAHWQTLWEKAHPAMRRVEAHDWENPVCDVWVENLEGALRAVGGEDGAVGGAGVVLVAHSLACLQVVHWAARAGGATQAVLGALLVAPPDPAGPEFPVSATGFAPLPLNPLPFPTIVVGSTDDVYATIAFTEACARAWGARFVDVGSKGHINAASGLGPWPEGLTLLESVGRFRF